MEYKDYYQTLGVARGAKQDELKRAYRKLARKYHPDVSKEADAEQKFKEVNEAYEVLKDPEKRAAYDQLGANWQAGQDFRPPPDWDANFEFSGGGFTQQDASAFSDFFAQMFGGGAGFGFGGGREDLRQPARDHHAKILIDLQDAFDGASRSITLQAPYVDAHGRVGTRPHTLNVKIPKGICPGQQIRLQGQGAEGRDGRKGDLYLEVAFKPHPLYRIDGRDLEFDLPIAPWEAALGATVQVPTPAGAVAVKIPRNSATDQKLRLKGRGLPGRTNGDLYGVLKIAVPPAGDKQAAALYRQMARELPFNPRAKLGV